MFFLRKRLRRCANAGVYPMTNPISDLAVFGWNASFTSQLDFDELTQTLPVRVMAVHRGGLQVQGPNIDKLIAPYRADPDDEETAATVGDWLLLDPQTFRTRRLLQRKCVFKRRAAGTGRKVQLIAANIDTLFIVSSCNQDFNIARLERYLALALEAEVTPVIVLTKADLCPDPQDYVQQAAKLSPTLMVEVVDARDVQSVAQLGPWCATGQTVALVGSSGVGKSTLINTLINCDKIATQGIREDDAKGRHTTTGRALYRLPAGGWLLDTPGMRELQLTDVRSGLDDVFADIVALSQACRFKRCQHETEPDCAIQAAIETNELDPNRLKRWRKLVAEERYNSESIAERRTRDRTFTKMVKRVMNDKQNRYKD